MKLREQLLMVKIVMWSHHRRRNKNKIAKKSKINVKLHKQQIQTQTVVKHSFYQDKNAQAVFLEYPELVELTMWTSFVKVVSPIVQLLLHETNQYVNRNKNRSQFEVTLEELKNFIELIFLSGYTIRVAERDYWNFDPDLRRDPFCETMNRLRFFEIKSFLHATENQSLSESRMAKFWPLYEILNKKFSNLVSLIKTLAWMSRCYLTAVVTHLSNSYVQNQFVSDTSYGCNKSPL